MTSKNVPHNSPTLSLQLAGNEGDHFYDGIPPTWQAVERLQYLDYSIKRKLLASKSPARHLSLWRTIGFVVFGVALLTLGVIELWLISFAFFAAAAAGGWYHWMRAELKKQLAERTYIRDRREQCHFGFENIARHLALESEGEAYDKFVSDYLSMLKVGSNDPATQSGKAKQEVVDQWAREVAEVRNYRSLVQEAKDELNADQIRKTFGSS